MNQMRLPQHATPSPLNLRLPPGSGRIDGILVDLGQAAARSDQCATPRIVDAPHPRFRLKLHIVHTAQKYLGLIKRE